MILAAWCAAATIGAAVDSVLAQTRVAHEVIVCDDGSPDDVAGALRQYGDRVRLLRIEHGGESPAKNAAAAAATGDLVVILDADDVWLPDRLAALADLAVQRPDLDVLTTDAWYVVDGERTRTYHDVKRPFPVRDQRREILRRNFVFGHAAVRREAWVAAGGFDSSVAIGADWDLWLRLIYAGSLAGCVDAPLAEYRVAASSLSGNRLASLRSRVELLDRAERAQALSSQEREELVTSRRLHRRRLLLAEAEAALAAGSGDARRLALTAAAGPGLSPLTRGQALAAAVAPRLAGHLVRRRQSALGGASYERRAPRRS